METLLAWPSEHPFPCEPFYCIVCLKWGGEGSGGLGRKEGGRARFSVDCVKLAHRVSLYLCALLLSA